MLLIKIFEWYGSGQEAIACTNNVVCNIAGTDRYQPTYIEVLKCIYNAIREIMKVLTCGIQPTFPQLISIISALVYIATNI